MLNRKFLFNTYKLYPITNTNVLSSGLILNYYDDPKIFGIPCVLNTDHLNNKSSNINVLIPFHPKEGSSPGDMYMVEKRNLVLRKEACIANSRIKTIKNFDFDKVNKISDYINEKGAMTFHFLDHSVYGSAIPTGKSVIRFLNGIIDNIIVKYRYNSILYIYYSSLITACRGDLRYVLNFLSIPNCFSILNKNKIDGMGIVFKIISMTDVLKNGVINPIFCMTVVLSNFKENIFTMDGVEIKSQHPFLPKYIKAGRNIINRSIKRKTAFCIPQKKKGVEGSKGKVKKAKKSGGYITSSASSNNSTTTAMYIDTSSAGHYFTYT